MAYRLTSSLCCSYLSAASLPVEEYNAAEPPSSSSPSLSKDSAFTAFCQLATLRTGTERSFLSLIDGAHQYIVAEGTRSHSLVVPGKHVGETDRIYLGVQRLDVSWGVCPKTMQIFTDETGELEIDSDNIYGNKTKFIIRDFRKEETFKDSPYVTGFPHMRSYAEVPLTSPLGYCIGSLCIVDDKPRDMGDDVVEVLHEIASTVMEHLELVRTKNNRARSEQLVEGLAQFMEGESRLRRQSEVAARSPFSEAAVNVAHVPKPPVESEGPKTLPSISAIEEERVLSSRATRATSAASAETAADTPPSVFSERSVSAETPLSSPIWADRENPFDSLSGTMATNQDQDTPFTPPSSVSTGTDRSQSPSLVSGDVKSAFSRAADIIRASMDLDGVSIVDACPIGFSSRSNQPAPGDQAEYILGDGHEHVGHGAREPLLSAALLANALRNATPEESKHAVSQLGERQLQRLIKQYPRGHIFSADEYGPIEDQYAPGKKLGTSSTIGHGRHRSLPRQDIDELFLWLKSARFFVFLPLWHFQRECWFSAVFAWVTDPTKAFDTNDLTYLRAFGNSVMAEVGRFEALAISRAKSDFISSISHELRTPLHGILASTELLRDSTKKDTELEGMLDMIESCGQTLLDTMNHLLDFAKINHLTKSSPRDKKLKSDQLSQNSGQGFATEVGLSLASPINLSTLVQSVAEAVCIGHASKFALRGYITSQTTRRSQGQGIAAKSARLVLVTIAIDNHANWMVNAQVGAWKRIVMNLLGNALKYTKSGTIEIGLRFADATKTSQSQISLFVKDTGIGISPEYLQYQLFTPFAQENNLSPGTGLGLSIVQQIVKSLGGQLDIQSQPGVGTTVRVNIPAEPLPSQNIVQQNQLDPESKLTGKSVCIFRPDPNRRHPASSTEAQRASADRTRAINHSVSSAARSWLSMQVLAADGQDPPDADIYLVDASSLESEDIDNLRHVRALARKPVVLLSHGSADHDYKKRHNMLWLRHPIGPQRLAKAFLEALSMSDVFNQPQKKRPGYAHRRRASEPQRSSRTEAPNSLPNIAALSVDPSVSEAASPSFPDSQQVKRVLLVDDNPINLKLLVTFAKRLLRSYSVASNGLEAVTLYRSMSLALSSSSGRNTASAFDLVLMDINMPVLNGFHAAREIRSWEREQGLMPAKIVAITGLGSEADKKEAFASGMELFMVKPVRLADLRALLQPDQHTGAGRPSRTS